MDGARIMYIITNERKKRVNRNRHTSIQQIPSKKETNKRQTREVEQTVLMCTDMRTFPVLRGLINVHVFLTTV